MTKYKVFFTIIIDAIDYEDLAVSVADLTSGIELSEDWEYEAFGGVES